MSAVMKSLMNPLAKLAAAAIVASFSLNAIADDTATTDRDAMRKETQNLTPEQRAEKRKERRAEFQKKSLKNAKRYVNRCVNTSRICPLRSAPGCARKCARSVTA